MRAFVMVIVAVIAVAESAMGTEEPEWNRHWTCSQFLKVYQNSPHLTPSDVIFSRIDPFRVYMSSVWTELNQEAMGHQVPTVNFPSADRREWAYPVLLALASVICSADPGISLKEVTFRLWQAEHVNRGLPTFRRCDLDHRGVSCE